MYIIYVYILICKKKKKNSFHDDKKLQIFSMLIAAEVEDCECYSFNLYSKSIISTNEIWSINKCSSRDENTHTNKFP